jgi:hypothetical protein
MGQQILALEKSIFLKSVIGIRQCQENTQLIEFVFEQSYPPLQMARSKAVEILTEPIFKRKWEQYEVLVEEYGHEDDVIIVCHRCLIPLNHLARLVGCNDECATLSVGLSLLTDPYLYSRQVINENCWEKETRKYMHPYLIYYALGENDRVAVCNRYFCNKCEGLESGLHTSGQCGFCEGLCDCQRCQGMDLLTKMMAVYVDNGGDLAILTNSFLMGFPNRLLETKTKKNLRSQKEREQ